MTCGRARRLFGAYWDDELTQAEREWLEAHFASCGSCREGYEDLARTLERVAALPRPEVPGDFVERTLARARRAAAVPDRLSVGSPNWIPAAAAAAVLAVTAIAVVQLRWGGGPMAPSSPVADGPGGISQPVMVEAPPVAGRPAADRAASAGAQVAAIPDTIFDHSEDVEFILDPFTLRKGRAHTRVNDPAAGPRGQQATITF